MRWCSHGFSTGTFTDSRSITNHEMCQQQVKDFTTSNQKGLKPDVRSVTHPNSLGFWLSHPKVAAVNELTGELLEQLPGLTISPLLNTLSLIFETLGLFCLLQRDETLQHNWMTQLNWPKPKASPSLNTKTSENEWIFFFFFTKLGYRRLALGLHWPT